MKKTILIIVGVTVVVVIVGIWLYLLVFGSSTINTDTFFSNFGISSQTTSNTLNTPPTEVGAEGETSSDAPQVLRQLTTRPVAGAIFVDGGIRYVERGTGHIYEISLSTGTESLLSGTTLPLTVEATFSKEGNKVIVLSEQDNLLQTTVGSITKDDNGAGTFEGIALPESARSVEFSPISDDIFYLKTTDYGSEGHVFNAVTQTDRFLFATPLRDIRVLWGEQTYVYTTPSSEQIGYIYKVDGNNLVYVHTGSNGLMALSYNDGLILSTTEDYGLKTIFFDGTQDKDLSIAMFPEKCVATTSATTTLYCADPTAFPQGTYPDDWYKGVVSFSDMIWSVNVDTGEADLLTSPEIESGRQVDVAQLGTNEDGTLIWFINKNDDTLWMFDTTL